MKTLLQKGYKAKKRPSGHDISTKFAQDNGGAIPPNVFITPHDAGDCPSNFLAIANTESNSPYLRACRDKGIKPHPARYPESLVRFFVEFLTDPEDLVVDPFGGSNVTGAVCETLKRRWISSELNTDYVEGSLSRFVSADEATDGAVMPQISASQPSLFEVEAPTKPAKRSQRRR